MVIATDADGVLTDTSGFNFLYGEKFFGHKLVDISGYTTAEIFGETKTREFLFGLRYFYDYCCRLKPRENAANVCQRLCSDGHSLYVVTVKPSPVHKRPSPPPNDISRGH